MKLKPCTDDSKSLVRININGREMSEESMVFYNHLHGKCPCKEAVWA
jgi:hypothetical protein